VQIETVSLMWDEKDFAHIPVFRQSEDAPFVLVVAGDYEEAIIQTVPGEIQAMVSVSG
jgi:hypothetical protein